MNKYSAIKTYIDGHKFDSKKEANRYTELKLLERAGLIRDLVLQPMFVLQDKFKSNGETHRAIKYIADFEYMQDGKRIIEDVKGMKTEVYKIKKKLLLYKFTDLIFKET